jgi:transcription elongation factor SPT5
MVDVVDGPLKGRSGTVRYIMRGFVFVQTREVQEHAGFICLQARHTKVRVGEAAGWREVAAGVSTDAGSVALLAV